MICGKPKNNRIFPFFCLRRKLIIKGLKTCLILEVIYYKHVMCVFQDYRYSNKKTLCAIFSKLPLINHVGKNYLGIPYG